MLVIVPDDAPFWALGLIKPTQVPSTPLVIVAGSKQSDICAVTETQDGVRNHYAVYQSDHQRH
jgi:hypothetical protein